MSAPPSPGGFASLAEPPPWYLVVDGDDRRRPSPVGVVEPKSDEDEDEKVIANNVAWDDLTSPEPRSPTPPAEVHYDYTAVSVPKSRTPPVSPEPVGGEAGPAVPRATGSAPGSPARPRGSAASFFQSIFRRKSGSTEAPQRRRSIESPSKVAEKMVKYTADRTSASAIAMPSDWDGQTSDTLVGIGMQPWVNSAKVTESTVATGIPVEKAEDIEWWETTLAESTEAGMNVALLGRMAKRAVKMSIPCAIRGRVWLNASGGGRYRLKNPSEYEKTCAALAREGESTSSYRRPQAVQPLCLNADGCAKAERVLACLAFTHPEIRDYCPWVPLIVRACLHWLDERDTYAVGAALIREPSELISTRVRSWLMLDAFDLVARDQLPEEYSTLCSHVGVDSPAPLNHHHPLSGIVVEWLENIHFWPLTRLLDLFILDGAEILHRMGLVILQRWQQSVTYQPRLLTGFARKAPAWYTPTSAARAIDNPDKFIADSMKFTLSAARGNKRRKRSLMRARGASVAQGVVLAVGESVDTKVSQLLAAETAFVNGTSAIVDSPEIWNELWRGFPARFRVKPLELNFSTDQDGYSLGTLFRLCEEECPTVLLIETTDGDRLGAFLSHPWVERFRQNQHYFGNGDSFVFSLTPSVAIHHWTGLQVDPESSDDDEVGDSDPAAESSADGQADAKEIPSLFMFANDSTLAVGGGGGGHAIQLDDSLQHGHSHPTTTFGNPGLLRKGDMFTCARCEVWSFSPRDSDTDAPTDDVGRGVATMMVGLTSS